ncbi:MAG: hypothetical protein ACTH7O_00395 [Microbacterium gubbeenense]|uniref:hypothetical protein n=1 Tax=Microbacterium gubbeenense TaxID=159896 RepID=UPI003F9BF401
MFGADRDSSRDVDVVNDGSFGFYDYDPQPRASCEEVSDVVDHLDVDLSRDGALEVIDDERGRIIERREQLAYRGAHGGALAVRNRGCAEEMLVGDQPSRMQLGDETHPEARGAGGRRPCVVPHDHGAGNAGRPSANHLRLASSAGSTHHDEACRVLSNNARRCLSIVPHCRSHFSSSDRSRTCDLIVDEAT